MSGRDQAPALDYEHDMAASPKGFDDYELVLGDILRGERATIAKSLLDVQRELKIKASYIAAIEDCDLSAFETPGFIAGYVRSYGRYLGLDPELVYQAFCEQSGFSHVEGLEARAYATDKRSQRGRAQAPKPVVLTDAAALARNPLYRAPKPNLFAEISPGAVASVAALLALIGGLSYGGLSLMHSIQQVTLAPSDTPVVALDIGPVPPVAPAETAVPVSASAGEALMQLYRPQVLDVPVLVARDGPISTLDPDAHGLYAGQGGARAPEMVAHLPGPPEALDAHLPPLQGPQPLPVTRAAEAEVALVAPPPPPVVMFVTEPVWVRVRAGDGTVLFEKTMAGGERFVVPQSETPPVLRAGNSGALFFAVNGDTLGPAGTPGSVTSNVDLSVAALSERYAEVDLTADPELQRLAELVLSETDE